MTEGIEMDFRVSKAAVALRCLVIAMSFAYGQDDDAQNPAERT